MTKEDKIIKYLRKKYKPAVILLGGSRAKNTERVDSDWDIYLIGDYKIKNEQKSEEVLGEYLDIAFFPEKSLKDKVVRIFYGPVSDLEVLFDNKNNLGAKIVEATKKAYLKKPKKLTIKQKKEKVDYLNRVLSKIVAYKKEPEVIFFHLANFYQSAILFWFEFRGERTIPAQHAISMIKSKDLIFYNFLKSISKTAVTNNQVLACEKILEYYKRA